MKFFFRGDGKPTKDYRVLHQSMDRQLQACKDYQRHLEAISPKLPDVARSFISAPWYYDFNHHDCPHDSWLMDLSLKVGVKYNDDRTLDLLLMKSYGSSESLGEASLSQLSFRHKTVDNQSKSR